MTITTKKLALPALLMVLAVALPARADATSGSSFAETTASAQQDLERSLRELSLLREAIAEEKLPLSRKLRELEGRLLKLRAEHEELNRTIDARSLELNNLRPEIEGRQAEQAYLSNLLDEYGRNLETRVHIAELQRYRDAIDAARRAPEAEGLTPAQVYGRQTALVEVSVDRLSELVGGTTFRGTAVDSARDGLVREVTFALIGPIALYGADDGQSAGLAEQRLGSLEPNMVALPEPAQSAEVRAIVATGSGRLPLDPSLGNALRIEATRETVVEHILAGGPVMVPILLMAFAALVVALAKWVQIARIPAPSPRRLAPFLEAVARRDLAAAEQQARTLRGPTGEMLRAGLEHVGEPKDLVEEVMFEKMLETRLRLQNWLPFVAMSASAAPLLGLLGTVTGMINTFKLITVFGTGDPKTLSSGISEALITTEYGLIVAIPSLLIYAWLSRRARRLVDGMEKAGVAFLNRLSGRKSRSSEPGGSPRDGRAPRATEVALPGSEPALAATGR
jgi:biopolymer transport protein ExbB